MLNGAIFFTICSYKIPGLMRASSLSPNCSTAFCIKSEGLASSVSPTSRIVAFAISIIAFPISSRDGVPGKINASNGLVHGFPAFVSGFCRSSFRLAQKASISLPAIAFSHSKTQGFPTFSTVSPFIQAQLLVPPQLQPTIPTGTCSSSLSSFAK